jgi:hypothetical protein
MDEVREFDVVDSRILCFLILEGVIQVPSPSSESDRASPPIYSAIEDSVGVLAPSSSDWALQSFEALVRADARDPVVLDSGAMEESIVAFAVDVVLS